MLYNNIEKNEIIFQYLVLIYLLLNITININYGHSRE